MNRPHRLSHGTDTGGVGGAAGRCSPLNPTEMDMSLLFGAKTVMVTDESDLVQLGIVPSCLRSEVQRFTHRYTGQRKSGVQYQRAGG